MSTFLPVSEQEQQPREIEVVRSQLSKNKPMSWSLAENEPLNKYQVSYLATMAFPTLFPHGKGDGKWVYPFANHPRFAYWAFNLIQRKRILQQSGIFLKQNLGKARLIIDELCEMAASDNADVFMFKV